MNRASRAIVGFWIILLLLSAVVISRMTVTTDLTALLPQSADRTQQLLVAQLRDGVAARLMLIGLEGGTPEALAEGSRRIVSAIRSSGRFNYVSNGDPADLAAERDVLMQHRYVLSSAVASDRFSEPALRTALERQLAQLSSPAGVVTKSLLPADPTGELAHILSDVSMGEGPAMVHGVWFSRDGTSAQLVAETRAPGFDIDQQDAAVKTIHEAFRSSGLPSTSRLLISGPGVFAVESRATIERDAWRLSLLAAGLVIMLLVTVYRSATPVFLSLLPVLTGIVAGIALVQLVFGFVHGITLGFGATLIGEAVDYPAYLFTHAVAGERLHDTLTRIWPTLRLAILTTVFGSMTMLLSSFTGLSQLGVLSVVGVFVAGFVTRWILPALAPRPVTVTPAFLIPLDLSRWARSIRHLGWVVWLFVPAAVVVITLRHQNIWDNDLANLSPISQSAKATDERLRKELGAPDVRYLLVIRGTNQEEVLQRSEAAAGMLHRLTEEQLLEGFDLPSFYVPSRETQQQRLAALPTPGALRTALSHAVAGLPYRTGLFQPFLRDVELARTGTLLDLSDLQHSALSLKVRSLLVQTGEEWIALSPLRGVASASSVADRITAGGIPGVVFLDVKTEAERLVNGYRNESLRLTLAGIVAIAGVLWWGLRSARHAGRVMLPALIAVLLVVAILLSVGERLSLFHLVSLLLVIGIGLNYALFFNRSFADEADRRRSWLSVTVCILATLSAFGALAFSGTPVLHAIGMTVGLGAFCSMIMSIMLANTHEALPCNR